MIFNSNNYETIFKTQYNMILCQHTHAHVMKHVLHLIIDDFCRFKNEVAENEEENGKYFFLKYFDLQGIT